ncbi:indolepyruvate oxidoreductase subunit beta [bacterium]|nr:indolepyruvate oxidoreductase subunit beta [bacterium]
MNCNAKNVLIAGVGGQGVLLVSEILSMTCLDIGYDVKKSEVHGMAQRGGSVVSHVRYGSKVYSPLIEKGTADVMLAFEELEALRWVEYLRPDGQIILNTQQLKPMPVAIGQRDYPDDILAKLGRRAKRVILVDGVNIARNSGNMRTLNIALLGALAALLELDDTRLRRIIKKKLASKTLKANLTAFSKGMAAIADVARLQAYQ